MSFQFAKSYGRAEQRKRGEAGWAFPLCVTNTDLS
jgi:hypothetical protein